MRACNWRCKRIRLELLSLAGALSLAYRPAAGASARQEGTAFFCLTSRISAGASAARSGLQRSLALCPRTARRAVSWCPRVSGILALRMGRRRKGVGDQRSRWSTRIASSDPNAPQPEGDEIILGTGENRMAKIEALAKRRQAGLIVVLEDPADAMNAGAVLRSCDAFGVTEIWFIHNGIKEGTSMRPHIETGSAFEPDSNNLQMASASASRWVSQRTWYSTQEALDELAQGGYKNVATCFTERSQSLYKCDLTCDKLALWVGNEFAGLSGLAISAADTELFIPMRGMIQSLNLSVAAAVCLNEISRQRASVDPDGSRFAPTEAEQKKMVQSLTMRRRSYRTGPLSEESKSRLERTWEHIINKSNRGLKDKIAPIEHEPM